MRFRPQALVLTLLLACASPPEIESRYQPSANALEIVAVLNRHVPDDTYRFEPARDFTGRNVYRSSLLRLENLERAEPESLQAGHLQGVIAFSKARALERIRAFELAARQYRIAARRDVYGLENLASLGELPPRGATLVALPMKIKGGSGAPLRAVALIEK